MLTYTQNDGNIETENLRITPSYLEPKISAIASKLTTSINLHFRWSAVLVGCVMSLSGVSWNKLCLSTPAEDLCSSAFLQRFFSVSWPKPTRDYERFSRSRGYIVTTFHSPKLAMARTFNETRKALKAWAWLMRMAPDALYEHPI